ncbi:succinate-semialdehyde dehydrogenase (NADP(+)) [Neobacillus piezotolerans]|uniref:Aldehyde dehydrogenase n=1 Tax=Neobacillus piezotolerans TaxID=2259171 RepID=A0A3D8GV62_9BACI|nr:NAD-dependent succinate-semialdehyde dehydrogenase [Neobacillus piezotolerans]RDU38317.1 succinate-semialdehyde dehydrogenase (NADP(+)) [Neobacillus piezotolerans]
MDGAILQKGMYINGEEVYAGDLFAVENPATFEKIGYVADGGTREAQMAVDAAHEAFLVWSKKTAYERAAHLENWFQAISERTEELARMITLEQGKPLIEARGEIAYANSFIKWFAEEAKRVYGETIPASSSSKRILVQKQPVGVVAAITPWNFPAAMITRKVAPALAAGCTVVIKPAPATPLTALLLAECAHEAGIPEGVINVVTTNDAAAVSDVWLEDSRVKKITFTGSTKVGKQLMEKAAKTVKKVSLELGGLAPFIIAEDADINAAVKGVMQSKFRNAGQTCVCANRIYVHENIKEPFIDAFKTALNSLRVGNGFEQSTDIGPLINEAAIEKVKGQIDDAISKGAKAIRGPKADERKGFFIEPVILSGATDDMACMREETFGPVAPVSTFSDDAEAVRRANNTPYGLAAYVFTKSLQKAFYYSENLEYGIVGVNDPLPATAQAPFGGMKESGLGREGSRHGMDEFLEVKYISIQL